MKNLILFLCLLLPAASLMSQNSTVTEVSNFNNNHALAIRSGDKISDYCTLVTSKKKNKGQETYTLSIFDASLATVKSVDILKPKETIAIQTVENGSHICILFANSSDKFIEYDIYDLKGNFVANYKPKLNEEDTKRLKTIGTGLDQAGDLISIPGKGFIRTWTNTEEKMTKDMLQGFDNNGKELWKWEYTGILKPKQSAIIRNLNIAQNNLFVNFDVNAGKASAYSTVILDLQTGKVRSTLDRMKTTTVLNPFGVKYDAAKTNYLVYGMYSEMNEPNDYYCKGIYFQRIDESGKITEEKMIDWTAEVKSLIPEKTISNTITGAGFYFLDANISTDGSFKIISERYARRMNIGVGVGVSTGGGGAGSLPSATLSMDVANMFVFNFSSDLNIEGIDVIEKKQHDAQSNLKPGSYGDIVPAIDTKKIVVFDFISAEQNDNPELIYLDVEKIKTKEAKYKVCSTILNKKGMTDKKEMEIVGESGFFKVLPAGKGKVMVVEFLSKTDELKLREISIR